MENANGSIINQKRCVGIRELHNRDADRWGLNGKRGADVEYSRQQSKIRLNLVNTSLRINTSEGVYYVSRSVEKLNEMDVQINNDLLAIMLLYSLPPCFENFRCAIESRDELPSPESLRVKVIEESDARKNESRGSLQNAMFAKKNRNPKTRKGAVNSDNRVNNGEFKFRCHRCREIGHKSVDCRNKRSGNGRPEAKNAEDVSLCAVESFTDVQETLQAENNTSGEKW